MDYLLRYELCFNVFHLLILLVYFVSVMYAYISIFTFKSTIAYALELTCDCHVGIKGILFILFDGGHFNEVVLRRARLVLKWVTVSRYGYQLRVRGNLLQYVTSHPGQLSLAIPP